jgi:phosphoglucosamine mutase
MSKLAEGFTLYPQKLENIRVADKESVLCDEEVVSAINRAENELCGCGRILVRKSGTEPVVRVMVEASSDEQCNHYVNYVAEIIRDKYGV